MLELEKSIQEGCQLDWIKMFGRASTGLRYQVQWRKQSSSSCHTPCGLKWFGAMCTNWHMRSKLWETTFQTYSRYAFAQIIPSCSLRRIEFICGISYPGNLQPLQVANPVHLFLGVTVTERDGSSPLFLDMRNIEVFQNFGKQLFKHIYIYIYISYSLEHMKAMVPQRYRPWWNPQVWGFICGLLIHAGFQLDCKNRSRRVPKSKGSKMATDVEITRKPGRFFKQVLLKKLRFKHN